MTAFRRLIRQWGGAFLVMAAIFALSARPAAELPHFGWADSVIKKSGHMLGYGLLALAYWQGFEWRPSRLPHAWGMAILYGASDELHQAFVPGRHASALDVLLFDGTGAALALWARRSWSARRAA